MSQTQQLIEEVRGKLEGATDYRLAQVLDLPTQRISNYVKGKQAADTYACAKIAEVLDRDPLEVIAQVEAEAARTEKKRAYWRSFFSGLKRTAHAVAWCGIAIGSGAGLQAGHAEAGTLASSHNVYYVKLTAHWIGCAQALLKNLRALKGAFDEPALLNLGCVSSGKKPATVSSVQPASRAPHGLSF